MATARGSRCRGMPSTFAIAAFLARRLAASRVDHQAIQRGPVAAREALLGRRLHDAVGPRFGRAARADLCLRGRRRGWLPVAQRFREPPERTSRYQRRGVRQAAAPGALPERLPVQRDQEDRHDGRNQQEHQQLAHDAEAATAGPRRPVSERLDEACGGPHRSRPDGKGPLEATRTADRWIWTLVAFAAASVLAIAIAKERFARSRPANGSPAPRVTLPLLDGKGKVSIEKGRVTVVDFWATWCAPCRASMPRVQKVWREYSTRGVDLYSVDTDDPGDAREAAVKEFLIKNGLEFPVLLDDGTASSAFAVASRPTMLVLARVP